MNNAKIAHRAIYPTFGNWKLTLDNFHECYHCQPSHPEYCSGLDAQYILSFGAGSQSSAVESQEFNERLKKWNEQVKKLGHLSGVYYEEKFSKFLKVSNQSNRPKFYIFNNSPRSSTSLCKFKIFKSHILKIIY